MRAAFLLGLQAVILCLTSCSSARKGEPVVGPMTIDTEKVARGEKVFMTHCHKCHPGGETGLGFAINNKPLPGPMIKTQVRVGAGAMPAFSEDLLPDNQLDDLIAYIQALRKQ